MRGRIVLVCILAVCSAVKVTGQVGANCFLQDYEPRNATLPPFKLADKTTAEPVVCAEILAAEPLGTISPYLFGLATAVWIGEDQNNPVLVGHLRKLAPSLIRFPGGSWSDIYFWNGTPEDLPGTIPDGGNSGRPISLNPQSGLYYKLTFDRYLDMRDQIGSQGLITVNYGYARYGTSEKPVEQAAHLAADWVRQDGGMTRFWEIGNENGGPWEAGWQIDTTVNRDGQPEIISGELYGRHFRIFADSMRAAAAELGETIYIGGQILHYDGSSSWNTADRSWNAGFFRAAGDAADFYVIHNYFGNSSATLKEQVSIARSEIVENISFIKQDILANGAPDRPIALTEWNLKWASAADDQKRSSIANGMQAVVLLSEMIKHNVGMSSRWLIANWESDGIFYNGASSAIPMWNPRPDYFYLYYLRHFTGDHSVETTITLGADRDVLVYATRFASGEVGAVVVNMASYARVVELVPKGVGVGDRFYYYSLKGSDGKQWPQGVVVNDEKPVAPAWGPHQGLEAIPAYASPVGESIRFDSPGRSVQYILIEAGEKWLQVEEKKPVRADHFELLANYPNPFNPETTISFTLQRRSEIKLTVCDLAGRKIATLADGMHEVGAHRVQFRAVDSAGMSLPSGLYFYRLEAAGLLSVKKMVLTR